MVTALQRCSASCGAWLLCCPALCHVTIYLQVLRQAMHVRCARGSAKGQRTFLLDASGVPPAASRDSMRCRDRVMVLVAFMCSICSSCGDMAALDAGLSVKHLPCNVSIHMHDRAGPSKRSVQSHGLPPAAVTARSHDQE